MARADSPIEGEVQQPREVLMEGHAWTMYDLARARDEERLLRAMDAYRALRGRDGGAEGLAVESRAARTRFLDRLLRRELVTARPAAGQSN
jgi:hypothetical protein